MSLAWFLLCLGAATADLEAQLAKLDVKTVATLEVLLKRHYDRLGEADGPMGH